MNHSIKDDASLRISYMSSILPRMRLITVPQIYKGLTHTCPAQLHWHVQLGRIPINWAMWVGRIIPIRPAAMTTPLAERQIGMLPRIRFFHASHDQDLGIDAQAGLNSIVTRKAWAAVYKLSALFLLVSSERHANPM
eukprot:8723386-Pyramimonas_sp.AAC.1